MSPMSAVWIQAVVKGDEDKYAFVKYGENGVVAWRRWTNRIHQAVAGIVGDFLDSERPVHGWGFDGVLNDTTEPVYSALCAAVYASSPGGHLLAAVTFDDLRAAAMRALVGVGS